jgi:putative Mg2+ transporter-C (MgtC) family protein
VENFLQDIGIQSPDLVQTARVGLRLVVAAILGAIVGLNREHLHKAAGVRTHMLVALGTALFSVAPFLAGGGEHEVSEVVKGIAAGIGFLGAGAILKPTQGPGDVRGLTTAASIWLVAAVGVASGVGWFSSATVATLLGWIILAGVGRLEHHDHTSPGH